MMLPPSRQPLQARSLALADLAAHQTQAEVTSPAKASGNFIGRNDYPLNMGQQKMDSFSITEVPGARSSFYSNKSSSQYNMELPVKTTVDQMHTGQWPKASRTPFANYGEKHNSSSLNAPDTLNLTGSEPDVPPCLNFAGSEPDVPPCLNFAGSEPDVPPCLRPPSRTISHGMTSSADPEVPETKPLVISVPSGPSSCPLSSPLARVATFPKGQQASPGKKTVFFEFDNNMDDQMFDQIVELMAKVAGRHSDDNCEVVPIKLQAPPLPKSKRQLPAGSASAPNPAHFSESPPPTTSSLPLQPLPPDSMLTEENLRRHDVTYSTTPLPATGQSPTGSYQPTGLSAGHGLDRHRVQVNDPNPCMGVAQRLTPPSPGTGSSPKFSPSTYSSSHGKHPSSKKSREKLVDPYPTKPPASRSSHDTPKKWERTQKENVSKPSGSHLSIILNESHVPTAINLPTNPDLVDDIRDRLGGSARPMSVADSKVSVFGPRTYGSKPDQRVSSNKGVRGQEMSDSRAVPSNCMTVPSNSTVVLSSSRDVLSNSRAIHSNSTAVPSSSLAVLSNSRDVPSNSTAVPSNSRAVSSNSRAVPSSSMAVLSNSRAVPSNSRVVPSNSRAVPSNGCDEVDGMETLMDFEDNPPSYDQWHCNSFISSDSRTPPHGYHGLLDNAHHRQTGFVQTSSRHHDNSFSFSNRQFSSSSSHCRNLTSDFEREMHQSDRLIKSPANHYMTSTPVRTLASFDNQRAATDWGWSEGQLNPHLSDHQQFSTGTPRRDLFRKTPHASQHSVVANDSHFKVDAKGRTVIQPEQVQDTSSDVINVFESDDGQPSRSPWSPVYMNDVNNNKDNSMSDRSLHVVTTRADTNVCYINPLELSDSSSMSCDGSHNGSDDSLARVSCGDCVPTSTFRRSYIGGYDETDGGSFVAPGVDKAIAQKNSTPQKLNFDHPHKSDGHFDHTHKPDGHFDHTHEPDDHFDHKHKPDGHFDHKHKPDGHNYTSPSASFGGCDNATRHSQFSRPKSKSCESILSNEPQPRASSIESVQGKTPELITAHRLPENTRGLVKLPSHRLDYGDFSSVRIRRSQTLDNLSAVPPRQVDEYKRYTRKLYRDKGNKGNSCSRIRPQRRKQGRELYEMAQTFLSSSLPRRLPEKRCQPMSGGGKKQSHSLDDLLQVESDDDALDEVDGLVDDIPKPNSTEPQDRCPATEHLTFPGDPPYDVVHCIDERHDSAGTQRDAAVDVVSCFDQTPCEAMTPKEFPEKTLGGQEDVVHSSDEMGRKLLGKDVVHCQDDETDGSSKGAMATISQQSQCGTNRNRKEPHEISSHIFERKYRNLQTDKSPSLIVDTAHGQCADPDGSFLSKISPVRARAGLSYRCDVKTKPSSSIEQRAGVPFKSNDACLFQARQTSVDNSFGNKWLSNRGQANLDERFSIEAATIDSARKSEQYLVETRIIASEESVSRKEGEPNKQLAPEQETGGSNVHEAVQRGFSHANRPREKHRRSSFETDPNVLSCDTEKQCFYRSLSLDPQQGNRQTDPFPHSLSHGKGVLQGNIDDTLGQYPIPVKDEGKASHCNANTEGCYSLVQSKPEQFPILLTNTLKSSGVTPAPKLHRPWLASPPRLEPCVSVTNPLSTFGRLATTATKSRLGSDLDVYTRPNHGDDATEDPRLTEHADNQRSGGGPGKAKQSDSSFVSYGSQFQPFAAAETPTQSFTDSENIVHSASNLSPSPWLGREGKWDKRRSDGDAPDCLVSSPMIPTSLNLTPSTGSKFAHDEMLHHNPKKSCSTFLGGESPLPPRLSQMTHRYPSPLSGSASGPTQMPTATSFTSRGSAAPRESPRTGDTTESGPMSHGVSPSQCGPSLRRGAVTKLDFGQSSSTGLSLKELTASGAHPRHELCSILGDIRRPEVPTFGKSSGSLAAGENICMKRSAESENASSRDRKEGEEGLLSNRPSKRQAVEGRNTDEIDVRIQITDVMAETRSLSQRLQEIRQSDARDCECAVVEQEVLQTALDLFGKLCASPEAQPDFTRELQKTNAAIANSLDVAGSLRQLCRHGRRVSDVLTGSIILRLKCKTLISILDLCHMQKTGELQAVLFVILRMRHRKLPVGYTLRVTLDESSVQCCLAFVSKKISLLMSSIRTKKTSPEKKSRSRAKRVVRSTENLLSSPSSPSSPQSVCERWNSTPVLPTRSPLTSPLHHNVHSPTLTVSRRERERKFSFGDSTRHALQQMRLQDPDPPTPTSLKDEHFLRQDLASWRLAFSPGLVTSPTSLPSPPLTSPMTSSMRLKRCDVIQEQENMGHLYDDDDIIMTT